MVENVSYSLNLTWSKNSFWSWCLEAGHNKHKSGHYPELINLTERQITKVMCTLFEGWEMKKININAQHLLTTLTYVLPYASNIFTRNSSWGKNGPMALQCAIWYCWKILLLNFTFFRFCSGNGCLFVSLSQWVNCKLWMLHLDV